MTQPYLYELLAEAFAAEGTDVHFTLMGDGNMHWAARLARACGVRTIHARHEHSAVSMAIGYARATGRVGVASVTMGPGFAQAIAAIVTAARSNTPIVLFAGDTPTTSRWALQELDQGPFARAAGAHCIAVRSVRSALADVSEAFVVAATEQRPVVLSMPIDLQRERTGCAPYVKSAGLLPKSPAPPPASASLDAVAREIGRASKPIIIAGRGAVAAKAEVVALAEQIGALLATTLPARGLFDADEFGIGIAGGFATDVARALFSEADLVIGIGASLGHHTCDRGRLFPNARVIQIDRSPKGLRQGLKVADFHLKADAAAAVVGLLERTAAKPGFRTAAVAVRMKEAPGDDFVFPEESETLDPRVFMAEIDAVLPRSWSIIASTGHSFYFSAALMRDRPPELFHTILDFGAIGSNLAYAAGIAAAQGDGKVVVFDGDGSFLMQVQELETIKRHGLRLLICVLNDGAYGAELHKLEAQGVDAGETIFGRPPVADMAAAFGLRSATVRTTGELAALFDDHLRSSGAEVWDIHVSRTVVSPYYRHEHWSEAQVKEDASRP